QRTKTLYLSLPSVVVLIWSVVVLIDRPAPIIVSSVSSGGPAAIDNDRLAGDVARAGRDQERGDAGELRERDEHALGHRLEHDPADDLRLRDAAHAGLLGDLLVD